MVIGNLCIHGGRGRVGYLYNFLSILLCYSKNYSQKKSLKKKKAELGNDLYLHGGKNHSEEGHWNPSSIWTPVLVQKVLIVILKIISFPFKDVKSWKNNIVSICYRKPQRIYKITPRISEFNKGYRTPSQNKKVNCISVFYQGGIELKNKKYI